jgi:hypothetical protein
MSRLGALPATAIPLPLPVREPIRLSFNGLKLRRAGCSSFLAIPAERSVSGRSRSSIRREAFAAVESVPETGTACIRQANRPVWRPLHVPVNGDVLTLRLVRINSGRAMFVRTRQLPAADKVNETRKVIAQIVHDIAARTGSRK